MLRGDGVVILEGVVGRGLGVGGGKMLGLAMDLRELGRRRFVVEEAAVVASLMVEDRLGAV